MKKLLLVLLVVTLASFLFVGCLPTTPAEGEGEGEGEGEVGVTVEITDSVVVDGKTYVSGGSHTITVTFPAPVVGGVAAWISWCSGDYRQPDGFDVVLFPNADRTVWEGSGNFGWGEGGCCASYVEVTSGECDADVCIWFPVIVDSCPPNALIDISVDNCVCEGCDITFSSDVLTDPCLPDEECCDDLCSGLASWSVVLYDGYPFDVCCDPSVCEEPIGSCSGTTCPIECSTGCLSAGTYWAVITLADNVGLETVYIAEIEVTGGTGPDDTCDIIVAEYEPLSSEPCVEFVDTHDYVGTCDEVCL